MSTIGNLRRYALMKARAAEEVGDLAIRDVWLAKQGELAGTALPEVISLNLRTRLIALRYLTVEDLVGATECELVALGFSRRDVLEILAAVGA